MKKYLICILQHRNSSYAVTAFLHIAQVLRENKDLAKDCKIVIAASSRNDSELQKIKDYYAQELDVDVFECNPSYPEKIQAVLEKYPPENFEYFIKHDEDLFLSVDSWKKLLTLSEDKLRDPSYLLTTVNLSTGIPTWYQFVTSFFPNDVLNDIHRHLAEDTIPDMLWGNNYSSVNQTIRNMTVWDEDKYWQAINSLPYDYKGIHPVRTNIWYAKTINEYIIANYEKILNSPAKETFTPTTARYFCNSFFMMRYSTYRTIFKDKTLYSDAFDEVPINRYLKKNNLSFLTLDDSCGVHILYNSVYDQKIQYRKKTYSGAMLEEAFSYIYFIKITHTLSKADASVKNFSFASTPLHLKIKTSIKQTKLYSNLYKRASQNKHIKRIYKKIFT